MSNRISDLDGRPLTSSSPRWRDWVPQGWLCGAGKHEAGEAVENSFVYDYADYCLGFYRIFRSIPTLPSWDGPFCGQKSELETLWSRILCAETTQQLLGQCYKLHIRYANKELSWLEECGNRG